MANRSAAERVDTCSPWATTDDFCGQCATETFLADLDEAQASTMLQAASNILYRLTGRQFPGLCESTIRPCSRPVLYQIPASERSQYSVASWLGSCGCWPRRCGCSGLSTIKLSSSVHEVIEVIVDGVALDPTLYRVDDYNQLVRIDGERWPCCPNLAAAPDEAGSFLITYSHGTPPPTDGVAAAASLACEFILACTNSDQCRLPHRVQSVTRQGISMILANPLDFFAQGRTGLLDVDMFISSVNPKSRARNSAVYSPDTHPKFRKTDTTEVGS